MNPKSGIQNAKHCTFSTVKCRSRSAFHFPHSPFLISCLPLVLLFAGAGCTDHQTPEGADQGLAADLARIPDRGRDRGGDRASPDAAVGPSFSPVDQPLGQLACIAAGLSTGSSKNAEAARQADLALLKSAGIGVMRTDFVWHQIEKTKGTFDFSGHDRRVQAALAAKLDHIAVLAYGNPWATTRTTTDPYYPPDDPADFARFVQATVTRYKGKISTYEIWNEPNAGYRFWKTHPKGDPAAFGALLKAAYKAAKAADPQARVLFGGPFFHEQFISGHLTFLADVYKKHPDLGKHFDGMALHPYSLYPPSVPPERQDAWERPVDLMLFQVRQLMQAHGDGAKPIYTTEVGWPVWKQVSQAQQARYLVRSFLLLAAAGSRAYCWYNLRDAKSHGVATEATFGLLEYSANRQAAKTKPSWTAYKTLLTTLGGHRLVKDLRLDLGLAKGTFAYRLIRGQQRATVLWSSGSTAVKLDLPLGPGTTLVTRVEIDGKQTQLAMVGKASLSVGPAPIFILEE